MQIVKKNSCLLFIKPNMAASPPFTVVLLFFLRLSYSTLWDGQINNYNNQQLKCDDSTTEGCQFTCGQCQNTTMLINNRVTATTTIDCISTNSCYGLEVYSASRHTVVMCNGTASCQYARMFVSNPSFMFTFVTECYILYSLMLCVISRFLYRGRLEVHSR